MVSCCGDLDEDSKLELPTPLHLAAKYGLSELTSRLLDLPDAIHSSTVTNCDGHSPEDLARIGQRRSLAAVLENFREVVSVRCPSESEMLETAEDRRRR